MWPSAPMELFWLAYGIYGILSSVRHKTAWRHVCEVCVVDILTCELLYDKLCSLFKSAVSLLCNGPLGSLASIV